MQYILYFHLVTAFLKVWFLDGGEGEFSVPAICALCYSMRAWDGYTGEDQLQHQLSNARECTEISLFAVAAPIWLDKSQQCILLA